MVTLITQKETFFIEKTFSIIEYISKKPRNRLMPCSLVATGLLARGIQDL